MAEYVEFENENRLRKYPFSESSSFVSDSGLVLEDDFIIDAIIYAYRPDGPIRLTEVDFDRRIITISDNSKVIGTGRLGTSNKIDLDYVVIKVKDSEIRKPAGSIYVSDKFWGLSGVHRFSSLYFSAACVCPINPYGVEGIIIDGQLLTGFVKFISTTETVDSYLSRHEDGGLYLTFKLVPKKQTQTSPRAIRNIAIRVEQGSPFVISAYTGSTSNPGLLQINLGDISREDICAGNPDSRAQDYYTGIYDTCKNPNPPFNPGPGGGNHPIDMIVNLKRNNGRFFLLAPDHVRFSTLGTGHTTGIIVNPITVSPSFGSSTNPPLNLSPSMSQQEMENALITSLGSGGSNSSVSIQVPGLQ